MSELSAGDSEKTVIPQGIYYKNDIGFSVNILLDQRMSNLHYKGPGAILNFSRYSFRQNIITEFSFARLKYNNLRPAHRNTVVDHPAAGIRYVHLRKLYTPDNYILYAGAQINISGNMRSAPRLGNSYLYADMIAELRPQADLFFNSRFLWRRWNIGLSLQAGLLGYSLRIPEYGVSYELSKQGGIKVQGFERNFLMPYNYTHLTTGFYIREFFFGESNPNWFRVGYVWDYFSMTGDYGLNLNNALHQFVIELYFKVR